MAKQPHVSVCVCVGECLNEVCFASGAANLAWATVMSILRQRSAVILFYKQSNHTELFLRQSVKVKMTNNITQQMFHNSMNCGKNINILIIHFKVCRWSLYFELKISLLMFYSLDTDAEAETSLTTNLRDCHNVVSYVNSIWVWLYIWDSS